MPVRTHYYCLLFLLSIFSSAYVNASMVLLDDLPKDAAHAEKNGLMLLVLVTLPTCPVCEYVKEHHIEPMTQAGDFSKTAIVRELSLETHIMTDFNGERVSSVAFARRYKIDFAPAILFLSEKGEQLHEPIVGMSSRDYYGFYLNRAIKKSVKKLAE